MLFKDITGQDAALEYLKASAASGKVASGYLFTGRDGTGRAPVARAFAKMLNCETKAAEPCESCSSCVRIENGNYPDLYWVELAEDEESIKIDTIRLMQDKVYLKPFEGRRKVFIIEGADFMTEEAQNCILKTLEEPPLDTVIILIAEDISHLLPTIISRCKIVKFLPLANYTAASGKNQIIDEHLTRQMPAGRDKGDFLNVIQILYGFYRDMLVNRCGGGSPLINIDRKADLDGLAGKFSFDEIIRRLRLLEQIYSSVKFNANVGLAQAALSAGLNERL